MRTNEKKELEIGQKVLDLYGNEGSLVALSRKLETGEVHKYQVQYPRFIKPKEWWWPELIYRIETNTKDNPKDI